MIHIITSLDVACGLIWLGMLQNIPHSKIDKFNLQANAYKMAAGEAAEKHGMMAQIVTWQLSFFFFVVFFLFFKNQLTSNYKLAWNPMRWTS